MGSVQVDVQIKRVCFTYMAWIECQDFHYFWTIIFWIIRGFSATQKSMVLGILPEGQDLKKPILQDGYISHWKLKG